MAEPANAPALFAQFKSLCQAFGIALEPLVRLERILIMSKQRIYQKRLIWFQPVINPLAIPPSSNERGLAYNLQMRRQIGLGDFHCIAEFTHAHFAAAQRD